MSNNTQNAPVSGEKFTRGEKCIFIHLVLTFGLILTVVFIYLVHLYAAKHAVYDVFKTRRSFESTRNFHIGMAYFKFESPLNVCNTILFSTSWSIAPGYCVAMRYESDMKNELLQWRITYAIGKNDLKIVRGIVHPLFIRASLAHNIGLFQHEIWDAQECIPMMQPFSTNARGGKNMIIGSRTASEEQTEINYYPVKIMNPLHCYEIMSFVENIREYEFCVTFLEKHDRLIEHGALVTKDNKVTGIFSWGDENGKSLPLVILNVSFYQNWIRQQVYSHTEIDDNLL